MSIATVLVATGAAAALGLAGYGVYRWLSGPNAPAELTVTPPQQLTAPSLLPQPLGVEQGDTTGN